MKQIVKRECKKFMSNQNSKPAIPVSPLCDIEHPEDHWTPGKRGGKMADDSKFIRYIRDKQPGYPPYGWKDITPYWGKVWPKSLSAWRTAAAKYGYYISVQTVHSKEHGTYKAILVCLNASK